MKKLIFTTMLGSFCALTSMAEIRPNTEKDQEYRKLYPHFVDGCSAGQRIALNGDNGGRWGHGILFIRGVEIDKSKNFPQLKVKLNGPDNEVGVSTDGQFNNINWAAIPTENTFFHGDLNPKTVLTKEIREAFVQRIIKEGWLSSVTSDRYAGVTSDSDLRWKVANEAVPVDAALAWSRQVICQRVPVNEKQLSKMVSYLNELNRFYFVEGHKYTWEFLSNNCSHTTNNAFSTMGILEEKKVDQKGLSKIKNISIPSNFMVSLIRATADNKVSTFSELLNDKQEVQTLMEFGTLKTSEGALTRRLNSHGEYQPELNQVYNTSMSETTYVDIHLLDKNKSVLKRAFTDERYSDLKANLIYFQGIYQSRLAKAQKVNLKSKPAQVAGFATADVYNAYVSLLKDKVSDIDAKLKQLK